MNRKLISIIVPAYNEEKVVNKFYDSLTAVLEKLNYDHEILFIDDGSSDRTLSELELIAGRDNRVKIISFSRNFGHMIALSAGLDHATGAAVISLDADLQHPPELISELIKRWEAGADVVNTIRKENAGAGLFKNISAKTFYWLLNRIARINVSSNAADFRLMDAKVVASIRAMKERSRFLRGLISWVGYKQDFIPYKANARLLGETKYSFFRMFAFAIDGITSFSTFPLRLATYLGFFIAFLSFIYGLYAIYASFLKITISGWASVLVTVLFMSGVQLIFLGIIGEYLARVYEETKRRPLYIIKKKIGIK